MKKTKQILSIFLAALMIVLTVPVAFAEGGTEDEQKEITAEQRAILNTSSYVHLSDDGVLTILKQGKIEKTIDIEIAELCSTNIIKSVTVDPNANLMLDQVDQTFLDMLNITTKVNQYNETLALLSNPSLSNEDRTILEEQANSLINEISETLEGMSRNTAWILMNQYYNETPITNNTYLKKKDGAIVSYDGTELYLAFIDPNADSITVPSGIQTLHVTAFQKGKNVETLNLPGSVSNIVAGAFVGWTNLKTVNYAGAAEQWSSVSIDNRWNDPVFSATILCNSEPDTPDDPDEPTFLTTGQCGDNVFWSLDQATDTLTITGNGEMWNDGEYGHGDWEDYDKWENISDRFKTVIIKDGVTRVGDYAFRSCNNIKKVVLENSVTEIGIGAFLGCFKMKELVFSNQLKTIQIGAFSECYSLSRLEFPESLEVIKSGAFENCLGLKEIIVPENVEMIESHAFEGAAFLERIIFDGRNTQFEDESSVGICYGALNNLTREEWIEMAQNFDSFEDTASLDRQYVVVFDTPEYIGTIYCYSGSTAEAYAKQTGMNYVLLDDEHVHTPATRTQPSTCKEGGEGYVLTWCSECNKQLDFYWLPLAPHSFPDNWVLSKAPTTTEPGLETRTCEVCGAVETREIPKLSSFTVTDENSGIRVTFDEKAYGNENVQLVIEEEFKGNQYLAVSYDRSEGFNIKTYLNGQEVQPNVPVTVQIPLPEDYDPNQIAVFHIRKDGTPETIENVKVENGYIVFTATSFSVYIVVDESSKADPQPENLCKWCGKEHTGFFGGIVGFFHRIFAAIFGARY